MYLCLYRGEYIPVAYFPKIELLSQWVWAFSEDFFGGGIWTIFKVFIEFVAILSLFYVSVFMAWRHV